MQIVNDHPTEEWDWNWLSENPGITMEDIKNNPQHPWKWEYISRNPNVTIQFINSMLERPWDWEKLSKNPGITIDDIVNNPQYPWQWEWVNQNPNVTMQLVKDLEKPWDWWRLSSNKFKHCPRLQFIWNKKLKNIRAANRRKQYHNILYQYTTLCPDLIGALAKGALSAPLTPFDPKIGPSRSP